jgi:ankyrin repeat protein
MVKVLLDLGADIEAEMDNKERPLHVALTPPYYQPPTLRTAIAKLLIERGANVQAPGIDNSTPLHRAVAGDRVEIAKMLVERGACTDARNSLGRTPLFYCCSGEMFNLLLEQGASVDARDEGGWTPLHFAVSRNKREAAEALLAAGADPNVRTTADCRSVWDRVGDLESKENRYAFFSLLDRWQDKEKEDDIVLVHRAEAVP